MPRRTPKTATLSAFDLQVIREILAEREAALAAECFGDARDRANELARFMVERLGLGCRKGCNRFALPGVECGADHAPAGRRFKPNRRGE